MFFTVIMIMEIFIISWAWVLNSYISIDFYRSLLVVQEWRHCSRKEEVKGFVNRTVAKFNSVFYKRDDGRRGPKFVIYERTMWQYKLTFCRFPELCTPNSRFVEQFDSITTAESNGEDKNPILDKVSILPIFYNIFCSWCL